jgi:hypothetical protein
MLDKLQRIPQNFISPTLTIKIVPAAVGDIDSFTYVADYLPRDRP